MDHEILKKIVVSAVHAPSGDNCQPWRFVWKNNELFLYNIPTKDNPVFNVQQRGSLIAHGALLENISLLSREQGYMATMALFPEVANENCIARISFTEGLKVVDPLTNFIVSRCTNRKPYTKRELTALEKKSLIQCLHSLTTVSISFAESQKAREKIGNSVSIAENFMLGYKPLHDYFFSSINWSENQENTRRTGLFVKTMELHGPQIAIFKLYSNWFLAQILNKMGMANFIAKENAKIYAQCGAFMSFSSKTKLPLDYVTIGRSLQRVWLTATSLGLSVQPVGGAIYLAERLHEDPTFQISARHRAMITAAEHTLHEEFTKEPGLLRMVIRIGEARAPEARSVRQVPVIEGLET